jgi:PST family polysaccharide transporter
VAPELIAVLFGRKWNDSGPVAAILFMIGPVLAVQSFSGSLLNAAGHPAVVFRFRLITAVTNVVGFLIAVLVFRDVIAVAVAFVLRGYLLLPLNLYLVRKHVGIPIAKYLLQMRGIAISTLAMAGAVLAVKLALGGQLANVVLLILEVLVGAVVFAIVLVLVERRLVSEVLEVALQAIPRGGQARGRMAGDRGARRRARAQALEGVDDSDTMADQTALEDDVEAPAPDALDDVGLVARTRLDDTRGINDV